MWVSVQSKQTLICICGPVNKSETARLLVRRPYGDIISVTAVLTSLRHMITQLTRWIKCRWDPQLELFTSRPECVHGASRWITPGPPEVHESGAELGQQRMLVGELEQCCCHTWQRKRGERGKMCSWLTNNYTDRSIFWLAHWLFNVCLEHVGHYREAFFIYAQYTVH